MPDNIPQNIEIPLDQILLNDQNPRGFTDTAVVDVIAAGQGQSVTATTLVLTHNRFGRFYLAIILPFHRPIARAMLRQVAA